MWGQESRYGRVMKSGAGAEGHFQFMPGTAKEYGLKNPYDFDESSDAAARKMADLMRLYGGDLNKALMAYNFGQGNLEKVAAGKRLLPAETANYVGGVLSKRDMGAVTQTNQTTIIVHADDAKAAGNAVAGEQSRVHKDMVRNLSAAVQ